MAEQGGKLVKLRMKSKTKANHNADEAFGELDQYRICFLLDVESASSSFVTTRIIPDDLHKIHPRTPIIHQVVGLVSELLINCHKNIKFIRIGTSGTRLFTLSLPERKFLYESSVIGHHQLKTSKMKETFCDSAWRRSGAFDAPIYG